MTVTERGAPEIGVGPPAPAAIGVFGKIRAQSDFLRINASDGAIPAFVRWLGNEALHQAEVPLGPEAIGFLFSEPHGGRVLVGVLGPSVDSFGRTYPFAVFVSLRGGELADSFPLVPALYRGFLQAAGALLRDARDLSSGQIAERLAALALPGPSDLAAAESIANESRAELGRKLQRRLFGDAANGQHYYAFRSFQIACSPLRGHDPGRVNLALDCPCGREGDASVWLELARRILQWPLPPAFFFRNGARPSLVISLGVPPPAILPFFAVVPRANEKIWPLTSAVQAAISAARKSLPTSHLLAIDAANLTVGELLTSLSA